MEIISKREYVENENGEGGYYVPAIGKCHCGEEVVLDGFICECDCGADYNMSGQRLAPREQWGEDTGEHLSDILRPLSDHEAEWGVDY